ncbi:MAG TPA: outer membrane protein assembly factor BamE [Solimonas sp.]
MRALVILLAAFSLSACQLIYKLPTRQGNVIEQKQLDQLKVGMTPDQVKFLLGTPLAASPFRDDRWDYVGYYKSPRGKVSSRVVSLYFADGTLNRMEGIQVADASADLENPDLKTVIREEKKAATEKSREESEEGRETGITVIPEGQTPTP